MARSDPQPVHAGELSHKRASVDRLRAGTGAHAHHLGPAQTRHEALSGTPQGRRPGDRVGLFGQERRPHGHLPVRRHQAEDRRRPACGHGLHAHLLQHVAGRVLHLDLRHHSPDRHDRAPRARGVDHLRRPGPRGHEHGGCGASHAGGQHASRACPDHPRPGGLALVEAGARGVGALGERARGRGGPHRVAGLEPATPEPWPDRRLHGAQLVRSEQGGRQLGAVPRHLRHGRLEDRALARQHEHSDRLLRKLEVGELAVVAKRLQVQVPQHRVERMLHRAGVLARRGDRHLLTLVQVHPNTCLGEEGGRRTTDDAPADDRHVGGSAHFLPA